MKANELHSHLVKVQADEGTKSALLSIIDQKIDNDMEKILLEMRAENKALRSDIRSEIQANNVEIQANKAEIRNMKWTVSIVIAVASILIALIVKYL